MGTEFVLVLKVSTPSPNILLVEVFSYWRAIKIFLFHESPSGHLTVNSDTGEKTLFASLAVLQPYNLGDKHYLLYRLPRPALTTSRFGS